MRNNKKTVFRWSRMGFEKENRNKIGCKEQLGKLVLEKFIK